MNEVQFMMRSIHSCTAGAIHDTEGQFILDQIKQLRTVSHFFFANRRRKEKMLTSACKHALKRNAATGLCKRHAPHALETRQRDFLKKVPLDSSKTFKRSSFKGETP